MIKSENGYFLLNSFNLRPNDRQWKLDDGILDALFNGEYTFYNK